jgi:hypothetical protein
MARERQVVKVLLLDESANVAAVGHAHRGPLPSGGESGSPADYCFLGHRFTRLVAQSARQADDRVIDRAAMGPERIGPDIFQSSPIMRRGARHRYLSF